MAQTGTGTTTARQSTHPDRGGGFLQALQKQAKSPIRPGLLGDFTQKSNMMVGKRETLSLVPHF